MLFLIFWQLHSCLFFPFKKFIGSRTAWQLHGTCTPLILMSKPCHTGVSLSQHTGHGGGSFHPAPAVPGYMPLALFGVVAYLSAGSPYVERVRLPYAAYGTLSLSMYGACQPAKTHPYRYAFVGRQRQRRGSKGRFPHADCFTISETLIPL